MSLDILKDIDLFSGFNDADLNILENHAINKTFSKNTIIINEGDESDSLYIIQSGMVKVFLSDEDGKEIILNTQSAGEYFGELALIDDAPRSASIMTMEECKVMIILKRDFQNYLEKNPEICYRLVRGLTKRLRRLTDNVKSLALMDVYGRVARTLIELSEEKDGKKIVQQKLTQRDIANMVGASREMVSRILRDLSTGGYITVEKKYITINERLPSAW